jgi:predicted DNA-binding antitoxin AbrB/MazE fold protein
MHSKSLMGTAVLLASLVSLVQPVGAAATAKGFADVSANSPYYNAVMDLENRGIISGYPDGTFKPDQVVNRAEALKLILGAAQIAGRPAWDSGSNADYSDVKDWKVWYYPYLNAAADNGIAEGYPDGTFKPEQQVNLVENLKMLIKAEKLDTSSEDLSVKAFADADMSQWYAAYLAFAKEENLIDADAAGLVHPNQGMTRGKLAELLYRLIFIKEHHLYAFPEGKLIDSDANEPISFSSSDLVSIFKSEVPAAQVYTSADLAAASSECGTNHDAAYFNKLVSKMNGKVITYTFVKNELAQDNNFQIQVMPNSFGYADLQAFKNDFDVCAVGAFYPELVSSKWLVSSGDCGGALDDSGLPDACTEMLDAIGKSVLIK